MSITKKDRFDVFKRDGFICQYCGGTPPKVILEIDHISPKSKGGRNNTDNYITSCFDCNRGKGKTELSVLPQTLDKKSEIIEERKEQLKRYNKLIELLSAQTEKMINNVCLPYESQFIGYTLADKFKQTTITLFLKKLNYEEVAEAMQIACSKCDTSDNVIKYFCGICWNKIKQNKLIQEENE